MEEYELARRKFEAVSEKTGKAPQTGKAGEGQQAQYLAAFQAMDNIRRRLIAEGNWNQPVPIKLKGKYR